MGFAKTMRDLAQRGNKQKWSEYSAASLAAATGMTVVSGDPETNFLIDVPGRYSDVASGAWSARRGVEALDLQLAGTIDGRPCELVWRDGASKKWGVLVNTITYSYDARLSVAATGAEPPFEILNREAHGVMQPEPILDQAPQPFGDGRFDPVYDLRGGSAGVGARLAEAAAPLLPVEWIHVLWDGEHVSYVLHPYSTFGLGQAPAMLSALNAMAAVIEAG